jgi:hypothetical protein
MITIFLLDAQGIFSGSTKADSMGPMPRASTTTAPPNLNGTEVAYWTGAAWEVLAERPPAPVVDPSRHVPTKVTRRQALQALLLNGYLDLIPAALEQIPDLTKRALAKIEFEASQDFERYRPLVIEIGAALNMDLDELFIQADAL